MRISNRTVLLESLVIGVATTAVAMALSPADVGLGFGGPHVVWLGVLIVAARYGTRGLAMSVPVGWGLVAGAAALLGRMPLVLARIDQGVDLVALVAAVLVGWVASAHERRFLDTSAQLKTARERAAAEHTVAGELRDALCTLRARADRLEVSLTFLRDIASRIEHGDAAAAASAALELALARTGARAGVVQLVPGAVAADGDGRAADGDAADATAMANLVPGGAAEATTLAASGVWTADGGIPDLTNGGDRAVAAVLRGRRPVRAIDLSDATASDSDLAAPLLDGHGATIGVVALRGVPFAGASLATLHDVAVVAMWLSQALARRQALSWAPRADATDGEDGDSDSDSDDGRVGGALIAAEGRFPMGRLSEASAPSLAPAAAHLQTHRQSQTGTPAPVLVQAQLDDRA